MATRSLLVVQALLVALPFTGCQGAGEELSEGNRPRPCGASGTTIGTRRLIGLPEQEAIKLGRRHGCNVRATVGAIVQDTRVEGLCFREPTSACRRKFDG